MKKIMIAIITMITINASAQKVELGVNAGNISSISVGLSTWNWLYVGFSYEFTSLLYSPLPTSGSNKYNFYTPMLFLQPKVRITDNINIYGAYHFGWFYDPNVGNGQTVNDNILSLGTTIRISGKLYANGELGYQHINQDRPAWITATEPDYKQSREYGAVGIRLVLNTHAKKKLKEQK